MSSNKTESTLPIKSRHIASSFYAPSAYKPKTLKELNTLISIRLKELGGEGAFKKKNLSDSWSKCKSSLKNSFDKLKSPDYKRHLILYYQQISLAIDYSLAKEIQEKRSTPLDRVKYLKQAVKTAESVLLNLSVNALPPVNKKIKTSSFTASACVLFTLKGEQLLLSSESYKDKFFDKSKLYLKKYANLRIRCFSHVING